MSTVGICLFTSKALYGMEDEDKIKSVQHLQVAVAQEDEKKHELANYNYHLAFGEQTAKDDQGWMMQQRHRSGGRDVEHGVQWR